MSSSFFLDHPDEVRFGALGPPGERLFVFQARQDDAVVTLKLEKQQVAALSKLLGELLAELARPGALTEVEPMESAPEPEWVVGSIGVSYDEEDDRLLLVLEEAVPEDVEGGVARVRATREQAAALAISGTRLVEAGRPPCPLCGFPLDQRGHACPKTNGHRPPRP